MESPHSKLVFWRSKEASSERARFLGWFATGWNENSGKYQIYA